MPRIDHVQAAVEVVFYRDILCPWCHLVASRLERIRPQAGPLVSWRIRPYVRSFARVPISQDVRDRMLAALEQASKESDAPPMLPDLLRDLDSESACVAAMAAVEAATFQSPRVGKALDRALREAAFSCGLDIRREEQVMRVAESLSGVGLDVGRLSRDVVGRGLDSWRDRLLDRKNDALKAGVASVPCVVVGNNVMTGCHPVDLYLDAIVEALARSTVRCALPPV